MSCFRLFTVGLLIFCQLAGYISGQYNQDGRPHMVNHVVRNANGNGQRLSYCRISTSDIITTAQATANRVLQGVCNPRELGERFSQMESQMVEQFNVLKAMVLNVEDKLRDQDHKVKGQHRKLHRAVSAIKTIRREKKSKYVNTKKLDDALLIDGGKEDHENDVYDHAEMQFSEEQIMEDDAPSVREAEISRLNSTIVQKDGYRMFAYYWRFDDLPYRMKNWGWKRSLRSESFYIFQYGYRMYIRIYPNQNGENVYIHVGITEGEFDSALNWPFTLKNKIQVLDHRHDHEDLSSRIWDPTHLCSAWNWRRPDDGDNYECVGLGFPQDLLFARKYIHRDSIVIKLTVYLD